MPRSIRLPNVSISPTFLLSIALHLYFGFSAWLKNLLLAAFLHECAHAVALWYFNVQIRSLRLTSLGAVMRVGSISYRRELICAAAGPAMNALLAAATILPYPLFGFCNLGLLSFNLLPLYPLDGGRIMRDMLRQRLDPDHAEAIESRIVITVSGLIMLASILFSRFMTHDLFPPLLAASVLLRPVTADKTPIAKKSISRILCEKRFP